MATSTHDPRTLDETKRRALAKRDAEQRRSPARQAQDTVPFADAMHAFWQRDTLSFAIPGHEGGIGTTPEFVRWAGEQAMRADLPMSHGMDRRDHSWKVLETAQQLFADAVGCDSVLFVTNGSSMSVRVAMLAVAGPGDEMLVARNVHKSVAAGAVFTGIDPVWIEPDWDDELEVAHPPTTASVQAALDAHPAARAVLIVSPDFYGAAADVKGIAQVCHARGVPLIVDDAWGLDYLFGGHPTLPASPIACGADIVIGSLHKTLTGLCQTSCICVQGDRIDQQRLALSMELERSTSASPLLLSSIDGARRQFVRDGARMMSQALDMAALARQRIAEVVPELPVVTTQQLEQFEGVERADPTHLCIEVHAIGLTGYQACDWLQDHPAVTVELVDHRRIMPVITIAHTEEHVERLVRALRALVDAHAAGSDSDRAEAVEVGAGDPPGGRPSGDVGVDDGAAFVGPGMLPMGRALRAQQAMRPRDAFFASTEAVPWRDAVGRVSAEFATLYPPGVPVLMPGERITQPIVDYLQRVVAAGGYVEGAADPTLDCFRVVAGEAGA